MFRLEFYYRNDSLLLNVIISYWKSILLIIVVSCDQQKTIENFRNFSWVLLLRKLGLISEKLFSRFIENPSTEKLGNVSSAMKLIADNMQNGVLPLSDQILYKMKEKHPHGKDADPEVFATRYIRRH